MIFFVYKTVRLLDGGCYLFSLMSLQKRNGVMITSYIENILYICTFEGLCSADRYCLWPRVHSTGAGDMRVLLFEGTGFELTIEVASDEVPPVVVP